MKYAFCYFSAENGAAGAAGGSDVREDLRGGGAGEEARIHHPRRQGRVRKIAKFDVHFYLESVKGATGHTYLFNSMSLTEVPKIKFVFKSLKTCDI
jgi:hypothetical protein